MKIRKASPTDTAGLSSLMEELMGVPSDLSALAESLEHISSNPAYLLLVAEQDGQLIGTVMGILCYDIYKDCRPFVTIENVIVSQKSRGLGVGKQLFFALEEWAGQQNAAYLMLVSGNERTGAHQFYQTLGYEEKKGFRKHL